MSERLGLLFTTMNPFRSLRPPHVALIVLSTALTVGVTAAWLRWRPDRVVRVVSSMVSHIVCSATFVSHLDPATVYGEVLRPLPGMGMIDWAIRYEIDSARHEVRTTVGSAFATRAVFRDRRGCVVVHGPLDPRNLLPTTRLASEPAPQFSLSVISESTAVAPLNAKLQSALDRAFADPDPKAPRRTKAIVVVHDGRVVAERYAPGYDTDTRVLGWSVTKSVTAALVGILVRQGRISVEQAAPVSAWRSRDDGRKAITIDELLRMTSGLALEDTRSGFDPISRMLFIEPDMARFAAQARLQARPGTTWRYSSGNTLLLSRIIRDAVGGHADDVLSLAETELFTPLGMRSVVLEFDPTGTPVGSTFMFATARDWARFGTLFLDDGQVGGRQILPNGWVRYALSSTLGTAYGAGIWLGSHWDMPEGSILASGFLGQHIAVIPSRRLVVVRFGATHGADDFERGLVHDVFFAVATVPPR